MVILQQHSWLEMLLRKLESWYRYSFLVDGLHVIKKEGSVYVPKLWLKKNAMSDIPNLLENNVNFTIYKPIEINASYFASFGFCSKLIQFYNNVPHLLLTLFFF